MNGNNIRVSFHRAVSVARYDVIERRWRKLRQVAVIGVGFAVFGAGAVDRSLIQRVRLDEPRLTATAQRILQEHPGIDGCFEPSGSDWVIEPLGRISGICVSEGGVSRSVVLTAVSRSGLIYYDGPAKQPIVFDTCIRHDIARWWEFVQPEGDTPCPDGLNYTGS